MHVKRHIQYFMLIWYSSDVRYFLCLHTLFHDLQTVKFIKRHRRSSEINKLPGYNICWKSHSACEHIMFTCRMWFFLRCIFISHCYNTLISSTYIGKCIIPCYHKLLNYIRIEYINIFLENIFFEKNPLHVFLGVFINRLNAVIIKWCIFILLDRTHWRIWEGAIRIMTFPH